MNTDTDTDTTGPKMVSRFQVFALGRIWNFAGFGALCSAIGEEWQDREGEDSNAASERCTEVLVAKGVTYEMASNTIAWLRQDKTDTRLDSAGKILRGEDAGALPAQPAKKKAKKAATRKTTAASGKQVDTVAVVTRLVTELMTLDETAQDAIINAVQAARQAG